MYLALSILSTKLKTKDFQLMRKVSITLNTKVEVSPLRLARTNWSKCWRWQKKNYHLVNLRVMSKLSLGNLFLCTETSTNFLTNKKDAGHFTPHGTLLKPSSRRRKPLLIMFLPSELHRVNVNSPIDSRNKVESGQIEEREKCDPGWWKRFDDETNRQTRVSLCFAAMSLENISHVAEGAVDGGYMTVSLLTNSHSRSLDWICIQWVGQADDIYWRKNQ